MAKDGAGPVEGPTAATAPRPLRRAGPRTVRRLVRASLLGAAAVLAYAAALVVLYDVAPERVRERARSIRLTLTPDLRADRPYDAPIEQNMWVALEDVPPVLVEAVRVREDRRFAHHPGVDPAALLRALASLGRAGGGSTITQQVARALYTGRDPTPARKLDEILLALWIDALFDKREIMEIYLNVAFFGQRARGIEAAARHYFGYSFKKEGAQRGRFDAPMAAWLAVTLSRPSDFNPANDPPVDRIAALLRAMEAHGVDIGAAPTAPQALARLFAARRATGGGDEAMPAAFGAYRDRAVAEAAALVPPAARARRLEVETHYRAVDQLYLERALATLRRREVPARDYPGAFVVVLDNRTGGVTAQVGDARSLYPGSLVKPFVLLCALLRGDAPGRLETDAPIGDPPVRNADGTYRGPLPLDEALARSTNTVFVALLARHGDGCLDAAVAALGARPFAPPSTEPAAARARRRALGAAPVDAAALAGGYLALATCGRVAAPSYVRTVWSPGAPWRSWKPARGAPAAAPGGAAAAVVAAMERAAREGTARGVISDRRLAAKTGTADGARQIGMVTISAEYTVLATFWNDDRAAIRAPRSGADLAPFMRRLNANLHIGLPPRPIGCAAAAPVQNR